MSSSAPPPVASAGALVHALASLPMLEKLELTDVTFEGPDNPILELLNSLSRLHSLKHLTLNKVGLSHVGALPVSETATFSSVLHPVSHRKPMKCVAQASRCRPQLLWIVCCCMSCFATFLFARSQCRSVVAVFLRDATYLGYTKGIRVGSMV